MKGSYSYVSPRVQATLLLLLITRRSHDLKRHIVLNRPTRAASTRPSASRTDEMQQEYASWSHEKLIDRVKQLEDELKLKAQTTIKSVVFLLNHPSHGVYLSYINSSELKSDSASTTSLTSERKRWQRKFRERSTTPRPFDPAKYSTRRVAFKLAYLGKNYNGFEYHVNNITPLPTIEEELWKALIKGRLIFPPGQQAIGNWDGCEYSKCGRTDKGVSAFGQVIALRVRSNRRLGKGRRKVADDHDEGCSAEIEMGMGIGIGMQGRTDSDPFHTLPRENSRDLAVPPLLPSQMEPELALDVADDDLDNIEQDLHFDPIADEIPYPAILNRLLPPDIRILAWCPAPPLDFNARFSCRERQYRYFFTQPAFPPIPHHLDPFYTPTSTTKDGWLNIGAMREAAKLFEGLHDFRNFCKVDASKQIDNFERRIFYADIEEVPDSTSTLSFFNSADFRLPNHGDESHPSVANPKVYTFTLHGSAFLWHQVRHMVAILFLVGQGLEKPSVVTELLDTATNPGRPTYEMAAEVPLVLWDCIFPHENDAQRVDALEWVYMGDGREAAEMKYGVPAGGLIDDLWRIWRERKINEVLAAGLLGLVAAQGRCLTTLEGKRNGRGKSQRVFDGGDRPKLQGIYTPVMRKPVKDDVTVINERYALRKGFENAADLKRQGYKRLNTPRADHDME